jgi:nucleoporin SEH1
MSKSTPFEPQHLDRITVLTANSTGTLLLTGSIDHRIKIFSRNPTTKQQTLLDTFTAHDADIRDAKFFSPTLGGTYFASIGNDLKLHVWTEDVSQPPRQGHRFRRVATIASTARVPFVSLDVKTLYSDHITTFLAVIDRQGLLSVLEPSSPDDLREWTLLDCFNVCLPGDVPGRGEETNFKVRFDPNPTPLGYINSVSDGRDELGLVACAGMEVKVYRSVLPSSGGEGSVGLGLGIGSTGANLNTGGASHRLMFYEAIRLPVHPDLVRDVAWAPFNVRGTDRIATACRDGGVRIFELGVQEGSSRDGKHGETQAISGQGRSSLHQRQQQSSLTTAITGRQSQNTTSPASSQPGGSRAGHSFPYLTTIASATQLKEAHSDVWSLTFDPQGQVLLSTGSDGTTKIWRKSVLEGKWMVFAQQDLVDEDDDTDELDEDDNDVDIEG